MLVNHGYRLDYNIVQPDFFVISTTDGKVESYMRFRPAPGGLAGFWVLWKADSPYYPKRLVTLMSDLFRPRMSDGHPPIPTPKSRSSVRWRDVTSPSGHQSTSS